MYTDDNYSDGAIEQIESEAEDAAASIPIYTISSYPTDPTLETLLMRKQRGEIEIPKFQRGWVWKHSQASQLVESFLLGLPVPGIFLYREKPSLHYLVIDGQQRLRTIWGFFEGKLPDIADFYLVGVEPRWEGKRFHELDEVDRIRFRDSVLRAVVIEQTDPNDNDSMYHVFERLNTGGTHLNPQEVRNSAAHGPFNNLMIELNEFPEWRRIFGREASDSRMRDVELVVRFCALQDASGSYYKPMKKFLNDYMKRNQWERSEQPIRGVFESTVTRVLDSLGSRPFHIRRGLNAAAFDSVMLAFARNDKIPSNVKSRWNRLLANTSFVSATTSGTTDEAAVERRIALASAILFN